MLNIQKSKNMILISNISIITFNFALLASWPREASRLEAVFHEAEAMTHEAEAKTHEAKAEAKFFGLEAEARPLGLTSLILMQVMQLYNFWLLLKLHGSLPEFSNLNPYRISLIFLASLHKSA